MRRCRWGLHRDRRWIDGGRWRQFAGSDRRHLTAPPLPPPSRPRSAVVDVKKRSVPTPRRTETGSLNAGDVSVRHSTDITGTDDVLPPVWGRGPPSLSSPVRRVWGRGSSSDPVVVVAVVSPSAAAAAAADSRGAALGLMTSRHRPLSADCVPSRCRAGPLRPPGRLEGPGAARHLRPPRCAAVRRLPSQQRGPGMRSEPPGGAATGSSRPASYQIRSDKPGLMCADERTEGPRNHPALPAVSRVCV